MKKVFSLSLILTTILMNAFAQVITPAQTTEQCPGVNITFTVTIAANSIQSVQPKALNVNPTVVQQPFNITSSGANKTFNFIGRFSDYNNKQTFTVLYTNTSGQAATWDATFVKIKSLLTANSFSQIFPNPGGITSPRCQITTHNISFANVKYGNPWESPQIGYGTITNYEYLLPSGWQLGATTSNGSTWIAGTNTVTVTSNLSTGDGSSIRIRPVNIACGTGLVAGQEAYVSISRPAPALAISAAPDYICSGSINNTIYGMPAGATIQWSLSNNLANITGSSTATTVTVQKASSSNGNTVLTATVTHCNFTYTVTKNIIIGIADENNITSGSANGNGNMQGINFYYNGAVYWSGDFGSRYLEFQSLDGHTIWGNPVNDIGQQFGASLIVDVNSVPGSSSLHVNVRAYNECGVSGWKDFLIPLNPVQNFYYTISPNPATDIITVSEKKEKNAAATNSKLQAGITEVKIFDNMGTVKKLSKYSSGTKQVQLNTSGLTTGIYFIEISTGQYKERQQIIIQH